MQKNTSEKLSVQALEKRLREMNAKVGGNKEVLQTAASTETHTIMDVPNLPQATSVLFTEDGIPVRTIYVNNLLADTKVDELKNYCEMRFGAVSAVRIHPLKKMFTSSKYSRMPPLAFGFVTFANTGAAYLAVQCNSNSINGQKVRFNKADSWHQPTDTTEASNVAGPSSGAATANSLESQGDNNEYSWIERINDDCLREIFGYLNIVDAVNLASTSRRLRCFAVESHYTKFVKLELKPAINYEENPPVVTLAVLRTMLQHFGAIIEEIVVNGTIFIETAGLRHLLLILKGCPNLQTISISSFVFKCSKRREVLASLNVTSPIQVFKIFDCDGLNDDWAPVMSNFKQLRSLCIGSVLEISTFLFSQCQNLEILELQNCDSITVPQLQKFFKAFGKKLHTLKLISCDSLNGTIFPVIKNMLPFIEELAIDFNILTEPHQTNCLAELNHLKRLEIVCSMYNIGICMHMLGNRNLLERLDIYGGSLDAEMCRTLHKFQRLQSIRLRYPMIEDEHMLSLIGEADLPELVELYCEACNSITEASVVALVKSKRRLVSVDILYSPSITFAAVRQIIDIFQADDRPHLMLNIDSIEIGEQERILLNANRHLLTVTTVSKYTEMPEHYLDDSDDISDHMSDHMSGIDSDYYFSSGSDPSDDYFF